MDKPYILLRYLASAGFGVCGLYNLYAGNSSAAKTLLFMALIGLSSTAWLQMKHRKKELL